MQSRARANGSPFSFSLFLVPRSFLLDNGWDPIFTYFSMFVPYAWPWLDRARYDLAQSSIAENDSVATTGHRIVENTIRGAFKELPRAYITRSYDPIISRRRIIRLHEWLDRYIINIILLASLCAIFLQIWIITFFYKLFAIIVNLGAFVLIFVTWVQRNSILASQNLFLSVEFFYRRCFSVTKSNRALEFLIN